MRIHRTLLVIFFLLPPTRAQQNYLHKKIHVSGPDVDFQIQNVFETALIEGLMVKMELQYTLPVDYTISLCGRYFFKSIEPVSDETVLFGSKWIFYEWANASGWCGVVPGKHYISISAALNASGHVSFATITPVEAVNFENVTSEINIKQSPYTTQRYKTDFTATDETSVYLLKADLSSAVRINHAKCNLRMAGNEDDYDAIFINGENSGWMQFDSTASEGLQLLKDIRCDRDNSEFFDTIVTTTAHRSVGSITFEAAPVLEGLVLLAIFGVMVILMCILIIAAANWDTRNRSQNERFEIELSTIDTASSGINNSREDVLYSPIFDQLSS